MAIMFELLLKHNNELCHQPGLTIPKPASRRKTYLRTSSIIMPAIRQAPRAPAPASRLGPRHAHQRTLRRVASLSSTLSSRSENARLISSSTMDAYGRSRPIISESRNRPKRESPRITTAP